MIAPATSAMTVNTATWMRMRLLTRMSGALVKVVGSNEWIAAGVGAGQLTDRAAPLKLQLGQVALPPGSGEERRVEAAQREVDDGRQVAIVAAHPVFQRLVRKRKGSQQAQRPGQRRTRVGQRTQNGGQVLEFLAEIFLGLIDPICRPCPSLPHLTQPFSDFLPP